MFLHELPNAFIYFHSTSPPSSTLARDIQPFLTGLLKSVEKKRTKKSGSLSRGCVMLGKVRRMNLEQGLNYAPRVFKQYPQLPYGFNPLDSFGIF
jgi:hypothetical protein